MLGRIARHILKANPLVQLVGRHTPRAADADARHTRRSNEALDGPAADLELLGHLVESQKAPLASATDTVTPCRALTAQNQCITERRKEGLLAAPALAPSCPLTAQDLKGRRYRSAVVGVLFQAAWAAVIAARSPSGGALPSIA